MKEVPLKLNLIWAPIKQNKAIRLIRCQKFTRELFARKQGIGLKTEFGNQRVPNGKQYRSFGPQAITTSCEDITSEGHQGKLNFPKVQSL